MIILASKSAPRKALLAGAGIDFEAVGSSVDEDIIKAQSLRLGHTPAQIAMSLAIAKAQALSFPDALIIGGDQVLEFDGKLYDKPKTILAAAERLEMMAGKTHYLRSGLVLVQNNAVIWQHAATSVLSMRNVSRTEIDAYLDNVGPRVLATVGAYELEGPGVRLFDRIEGDYFSILGLALLPLLDALREHTKLPW